MNNQTSTFPWHHAQIVRSQPRRVSLSMHSKRSRERSQEDQRIITGIQFSSGDSLISDRCASKTSYMRSRQAATETEPIWVSVLGGVGVAIGLIACWVLI